MIVLTIHRKNPGQSKDCWLWPDPAALGDGLRRVQEFNLNLLPASLRPFVEDTSERMQTPVDFAAAVATVALAGCVNRRAAIIPKTADTGWQVIPNLWGAIVGPPGFMKSPLLRNITLPLIQVEESWREDFKRLSAEFADEEERSKLRLAAWRDATKLAFKKGLPEPPAPTRGLSRPIQKRLILTDTTFEKAHEILRDNPAGLLMVRDELTGWLSQLDKQGREGERGFFLQSWNGDGAYQIDRIGRGSIYVPHVCISLIGNIQPSRLRAYLADALAGGPTDDGLFQRFQILVWPDLRKGWKLVDRAPNSNALKMASHVFSMLANLSADAQVLLRFDGDAQQLFYAWWADLEVKIRESDLPPAVVSHISKYRKLMPSLAGLFELADRVAAGSDLGFEAVPVVSSEHVVQAAGFCSYLESHVRRAYDYIVRPRV